MNKYIDIKRIEFMVTMQCSSRCKHCSIGDKLNTGNNRHINIQKGVEAIGRLAKAYQVESIMTFGGEPLLYFDVTAKLHQAAKEAGIPKRQLITNGYFSKDKNKIEEAAQKLWDAGVNALLLSVDAFHQESIPIDMVACFAEVLLERGMENIKLHPAWLVSQTDCNPYNEKTRQVIDHLSYLNIPVSSGNVISPTGNAAKFLKEYFKQTDLKLPDNCTDTPYSEPLDQLRTISIDQQGDVYACTGFVIGNIYSEDIMDIICRYNPFQDKHMGIVIQKGIVGLLEYAKEYDIMVNKEKYYSICSLCLDIRRALKEQGV